VKLYPYYIVVKLYFITF